MAVKRINPASIKKYGDTATEQFKSIHTNLESLVTKCATVHYRGTNATEFKTKASDLAAQYATDTQKNMNAIAEAVQMLTTALSKSMGGVSVTVSLPRASAIQRPSITREAQVEELDTTALETLIPDVQSLFSKIEGTFDAHLRAFSGTDWQSDTKNKSEAEIRKFTTDAKQVANESQQAIVKYVRSQIDAVKAADASA
ncbi:MAG TPA: hypothetical protein VNQ73_18925 [Ilumatobacter sp.]|nr:hypothetical protein [Ilumatobacter sp.]